MFFSSSVALFHGASLHVNCTAPSGAHPHTFGSHYCLWLGMAVSTSFGADVLSAVHDLGFVLFFTLLFMYVVSSLVSLWFNHHALGYGLISNEWDRKTDEEIMPGYSQLIFIAPSHVLPIPFLSLSLPPLFLFMGIVFLFFIHMSFFGILRMS